MKFIKLPFRLNWVLPISEDVVLGRLKSIVCLDKEQGKFPTHPFVGTIDYDKKFELVHCSIIRGWFVPVFRGEIVEKDEKTLFKAQLILYKPINVVLYLMSLLIPMMVSIINVNFPKVITKFMLMILIVMMLVYIMNVIQSVWQFSKALKREKEDLV